MKTINVQISDDSVPSVAISDLDGQISDSTRNSPEFQVLYGQVTACIEDFIIRAKILARSGTTIHIEKEFLFPDTKIFINLDYPKKTGLIEKIKGIFRNV